MFTVQAGCFGICGVNFVQNSVAVRCSALFCVVLRGKLWYTIYRIVYVLPCAVRPDQNSGGKTYAPTAV